MSPKIEYTHRTALLISNPGHCASGWFSSAEALRYAVFYFDSISRLCAVPSMKETANYYDAAVGSAQTQSLEREPHLFIPTVPLDASISSEDIMALCQNGILRDYVFRDAYGAIDYNAIHQKAFGLFEKYLTQHTDECDTATNKPVLSACIDSCISDEFIECCRMHDIDARYVPQHQAFELPASINSLFNAALIKAFLPLIKKPSAECTPLLPSQALFAQETDRGQKAPLHAIITYSCCLTIPSAQIGLHDVINIKSQIEPDIIWARNVMEDLRYEVRKAESLQHMQLLAKKALPGVQDAFKEIEKKLAGMHVDTASITAAEVLATVAADGCSSGTTDKPHMQSGMPACIIPGFIAVNKQKMLDVLFEASDYICTEPFIET